MNILILFLLCIIQGLTEFLPVSSSGHLLLIEQLFGVQGDLLLLNLFLHLASLFAVLIVYRKTILNLIKKPFQPLMYKLVISTIITCVFALCYKCFNIDFYVKKIYCFGFLITSILLYFCYIFQKKGSYIKVDNISYKDAVIVGTVQGFATIPGLSRSGSTIASLMFCANNENTSSEYSFLLSVPIIIGGFIIELIDNDFCFTGNFNFYVYAFAFVLTFFVSILALKLTVKLLKNKKFNVFSIYTFLLFIVVFVINYTK